MCGETSNTLNLLSAVCLGIPCVSITGILLSLAEVETAGQFADDVEVGAAAAVGLQWGGLDEGLGGEVAWAEVSVGSHLLAELENALFWADCTGSPFWATNGSEKDSVGGLGRGEGLVCKWGAVCVDGALT